jgi:hypothetical protein
MFTKAIEIALLGILSIAVLLGIVVPSVAFALGLGIEIPNGWMRFQKILTGDCSKRDCLNNLTPEDDKHPGPNGYKTLFPNYNYKGASIPNSNSYADYVTHACGLDFDFPNNAKGWDFHRKNPQSP